MSHLDINVETLLIVAIWNQPAIFQGCFKVSALHSHHEEYFLFRCEVRNGQLQDFIDSEFYPDNYYFTHFYAQEQRVQLDMNNESLEYALYLLKYSLYITLKEMLINKPQKQHLLSMDDMFVDSLLEKIKPILNKDPLWDESMKEIGFAVAMDFCPSEKMGETAVQLLLSGLVNHEFTEKKVH
ncbi:hypothetical protein OQJ13_00725 [Legionella sp. PATHC035]|uniref:hypothetical protein n=1 Tax=Legionella sp. PATHC035 TaxID=2992040 RepID=UPI002244A5EC|nr:hypothetical protein [Legionella sp. PATHC035]MCW8407495.1 hypothetical protein [Legionella sp. PATHC035]